MAQQLKALAALSEVLSSVLSTHSGSSQPSITGPGALFWHAGTRADSTHTLKI